ncbi:MAG: RNA polymerase sigma-70 factor [Bacteroidota bacterium]
MTNMTEEQQKELLERLRSNDRDALQLLFRNYYPAICRSIYRYHKDPQVVEDIAQDLFLKIWEKRHRIQIKSSLQAYLHRMAVNESIDYLRKIKRLEQKKSMPQAMAVSTMPSAEEEYLGLELQERINACINALPPRCQLIFKLSRYEEMTYKQIAEQLEISVKTVENQMGKALKILRGQLQ